MPHHDFPCFFGVACVLDGLGFVLMSAASLLLPLRQEALLFEVGHMVLK